MERMTAVIKEGGNPAAGKKKKHGGRKIQQWQKKEGEREGQIKQKRKKNEMEENKSPRQQLGLWKLHFRACPASRWALRANAYPQRADTVPVAAQ